MATCDWIDRTDGIFELGHMDAINDMWSDGVEAD